MMECIFSRPMSSAIIIAMFAVVVLPASGETATTHTLQSRRSIGQTDRVTVLLEVGGQTKYVVDDKPQNEDLSVRCNLVYFEKTLSLSTAADAVCRSIRDYEKAEAQVKVGDAVVKPKLRSEHRLIVAEAGEQQTVLFSPSGNLTREELDAIEIQCDSLLLDRLLPDGDKAVGDQWQHTEQLLAALLGLDEVSKSTVRSVLKEVTDIVARFEITGRVDGAIGGVSTKIDVKGKYRFDLRSGRIDWLGILIKENRENSFVADGVDVVSRLQVTVVPAQEPASMAEAALAGMKLQSTPESTCLAYVSPDGLWQCLYDRRWHLLPEHPQTPVTVMRLIDHGELIGQCNFSSLPQTDPTKLISLEDFQADVRRALGKNFGEFIEAGQTSNKADHRVYRVVVHGVYQSEEQPKLPEIPMRWIYYHIADAQGRCAALTFAVEQNALERFADADKRLVDLLQFTEKKGD